MDELYLLSAILKVRSTRGRGARDREARRTSLFSFFAYLSETMYPSSKIILYKIKEDLQIFHNSYLA